MITCLLFQKSLSVTSQPQKTPEQGKEWIRNPFVNKPGESTLTLLEEDQLVEMANDGGLKTIFEINLTLLAFWIKVKAEFPNIATKALKALLPFPTSYFVKRGFYSDSNQNNITE